MIGEKITNFKMWCQKVLPLVYDDSLSYYETLCKVTTFLNEVITQMNALTESEEEFQTNLNSAWNEYKTDLTEKWEKYSGDLTKEWTDYSTALTTVWEQYKNFIDTYFENLSVQNEVNIKLDEMASDGSLSALIEPLLDVFEESIKNRISVLEGRMDTFASLPPGSTSGNAELLDIRVGANGTTYPSAGDAVRGQASQLSESVAEIKFPKTFNYQIVNGYLDDDGSLKNNDGFVSLMPIYLHKGDVITQKNMLFGMTIRYWGETVSRETHQYIVGKRYASYVVENDGYHGIVMTNISGNTEPINAEIIRSTFDIKNININDINSTVEKHDESLYGVIPYYEILHGKQCSDANRLNTVDGWCAITALYLKAGTIMKETNDNNQFYIRSYGLDTSWNNVVRIGYIKGEYIVPSDGYYSVTMNNDGATFSIYYKSAFERIEHYNGAYFITNLAANNLAISSDPRIMEAIFPTRKGLGTKIELNAGDVECIIKYIKNGAYVEDKGTFYENTWAKKHAIIHYLDCDHVVVRFRIYDGTSVHTLTDSDKSTIINSIKNISVGTYTYTADSKSITDNALETRLRGVSVPRETIVSIAHQGYSYSDTLGRSHLEGYKEVAKLGFEYGETDLKLTKDNIIVCCHDDDFVDKTTGQTIVIRDKTLAELKACNYYGGKIATFDEVIRECKIHGINLMIDHLTTTLVDMAMPIVKKYSMEHNVIWTLSSTDVSGEGITDLGNHILAIDPCAKLMSAYSTEMNQGRINAMNTLKTPNNTIICGVYFERYSPEQIATLKASFDYGIEMCVWTVDKLSAYLDYLPYCKYILSNEFSYRMVCEAGIIN